MSGEELFYHRDVLRVIRAVLVSKGVRDELEDHIHDVVVKGITRVRGTGRPPANVAEAIAIARPIAGDYAIDVVRKRAGRSKTDQGQTADADEHAHDPGPKVDPVDEKRMIEAIRAELGEAKMEDFIDLGSGASHAELAADRGIAPAAGRKRTERDRKTALNALGVGRYVLVGGLAALAGMWLLHIGPWHGDDNTAGRRPRGSDRSLEVAAEQRRVAAEACGMRDWDVCERSLDRAAVLDPEGDHAAEVKALRETIAAGRRATAVGDGGGK
jgi:hypothetical protein